MVRGRNPGPWGIIKKKAEEALINLITGGNSHERTKQTGPDLPSNDEAYGGIWANRVNPLSPGPPRFAERGRREGGGLLRFLLIKC